MTLKSRWYNCPRSGLSWEPECSVCGRRATPVTLDGVPSHEFHTYHPFTRAEALAFGERVREACADAVLENPKAMFRAVRAVDVARLLEET